MRVFNTFGILLFVASLVWVGEARGQIGFAENQADRIRLWNADYYEFAFRKADGRILYIIDKTTGQEVSPGNVHGPWVLRYSDNTWLDGQGFSPTNPSRLFSYAWDAPSSTLTLNYVATGTHACQITLTIKATESPELDTTLSISGQSSHEIELLAYPVQLSFRRSQIESVYVPYLEGVRLFSSFFATQEFGNRYPGQMFGDFAYADLSVGSFAVYGVHDLLEPIKPAMWLILRDDSYAGGVSKYHHDYDVAIQNGDQWSTPTMVISVGSSLDEAMDAYWTRSGHDAMPTLEAKLGTPTREKLAGAVLIKAGLAQGPWTFASLQAYLSNLPVGNLLHLVTFWPRGFDENYPDYLPPDSSYGTLSELQTLVSTAQSSGHLVMPYTNPTWWDDQSPTLGSLGTGIVARDRNNSLVYEYYNGHGGYVVCPYSPDVIARQDQTRNEFTVTVPCDLMFEDQVGARQQPAYDGNPAAPDPTLYTQGLVEVAQRSAMWLPIMTEGGFDRVSWHESGFCNSQTIGWQTWTSGTYTAYPMAPLWAHKNLYFNAHNLAGDRMANDLPGLTYYMSMGYALSHDLSMVNLSWLATLDCFQKHLIAPLIGGGMASFEYLPTSGQTQTTFDNGTEITANLTAGTMSIDDHVVAANGFLAELGGKVLGGVLTTLNGQSLSGSSPHYLIFEYEPNRISVYQPQGDNGTLTIDRPVSWTDDSRIHAYAVTDPGSTFSRPVTIQPASLAIDYLASISGQSVDRFILSYCGSGDADCDGDADLIDFAAFADCLSGPGATVNPTPPRTVQDCLDTFDADSDLDVDHADYAAFQGVFTGD